MVKIRVRDICREGQRFAIPKLLLGRTCYRSVWNMNGGLSLLCVYPSIWSIGALLSLPFVCSFFCSVTIFSAKTSPISVKFGTKHCRYSEIFGQYPKGR